MTRNRSASARTRGSEPDREPRVSTSSAGGVEELIHHRENEEI